MLFAAALPTGSRKCAPALASQYRSRRCPPPPTPHTLAAAAAPATAVSLCPSPRLVCGPAAVRGGARLDSQRRDRRWDRHYPAASLCASPAAGDIPQARMQAARWLVLTFHRGPCPCSPACMFVMWKPVPASPGMHCTHRGWPAAALLPPQVAGVHPSVRQPASGTAGGVYTRQDLPQPRGRAAPKSIPGKSSGGREKAWHVVE